MLSPEIQPAVSSPSAPAGEAHAPTPEGDGWDQLGAAVLKALPPETHVRLLWLLIAVSIFLRLLWITLPAGSLIFDEKYYVNAARMLAGVAPDADMYQDKPLGLDPNTEHPPLAKLIVAASIRMLGDDPIGWRLPSVLFGVAAIVLLYRIGQRVADDPYVGLVGAAFLAFDNLVFVHSRIFTLDISMLAFMLLGFDLYLRGHPLGAGGAFALAALCKLPGGLGILAIAGFEALRLMREPGRSRAWLALAPGLSKLIGSCVVIFLVLLTIFDRQWVGYDEPFAHLRYMFSYAQALQRQQPSGVESYPWQWLWNDVEIPYLKVDQEVKAGDRIVEERPTIFFRGAMNPFVLTLWPAALGMGAYVWWRRQPGADVGALVIAWFTATFLPFLAESLFGHRISYIFYFLPVLPSIALGGSYFYLTGGLPRLVLWCYLGAVLVSFIGYFPFRPVS